MYEDIQMRYNTKIYGHRGYSEKYPENTMTAFLKAYEAGADGIETDVQRTKDGYLVLVHDESVDRASDGKGRVCDMTLAELRGLSFNRLMTDCKDGRIPLLSDLLEAFKGAVCKGRCITNIKHSQDCEESKVYEAISDRGGEAITDRDSMARTNGDSAATTDKYNTDSESDISKTEPLFRINLELKNSLIPYPNMEEEVIALIKECGMIEQFIFSSFNHESIVRVRGLCPEAKTGFLVGGEILAEPWKYISGYGVNAYHPSYICLRTIEDIEKSHAAGVEINTWTVNMGSIIRRLCDWGVDGIITNRVELGCEIVNDKK